MTEGKSNKPIVLVLLAVIGCMVVLVSFAVPLYSIFCQATGYGGTTQRAEHAAANVLDRVMTVRFNADVDPHLPWDFHPMQESVKVHVGQPKLVKYIAKNLSNEPITGHAVFNVTPQKAGLYFSKIQCFCFTEQTLQPGESLEMPVTFFIDPDIAKASNEGDVHTITLSYTFYRDVESAEAKTPTDKTSGADGGKKLALAVRQQ